MFNQRGFVVMELVIALALLAVIGGALTHTLACVAKEHAGIRQRLVALQVWVEQQEGRSRREKGHD